MVLVPMQNGALSYEALYHLEKQAKEALKEKVRQVQPCSTLLISRFLNNKFIVCATCWHYCSPVFTYPLYVSHVGMC